MDSHLDLLLDAHYPDGYTNDHPQLRCSHGRTGPRHAGDKKGEKECLASFLELRGAGRRDEALPLALELVSPLFVDWPRRNDQLGRNVGLGTAVLFGCPAKRMPAD